MSRHNHNRTEKNYINTKYKTIDDIAERENGSIKSILMIGPVQQPRLNFTYRVDGFVFNTGKRHRGGGIGVNMKAGGY